MLSEKDKNILALCHRSKEISSDPRCYKVSSKVFSIIKDGSPKLFTFKEDDSGIIVILSNDAKVLMEHLYDS